MARNPPQSRDGKNRFTRNQARRKLLMVTFGVLVAFLLYRYYFGGSETPVVASQTIDRSSLYVGNKYNAGKSTFRRSSFDKAKDYVGVKEGLETKDEDTDDAIEDKRNSGEKREELKSTTPEDSHKKKSTELNPVKDGDNKTGANLTATSKTNDKINTGNSSIPAAKMLNKTNVSGNKSAATNYSTQLKTNLNGTVSTYAKNATNTSTVLGKFNNQTHGNISMAFPGNKNVSNLAAVSKYEMNCVEFRVKSLNKTNNRMCQHNISNDDLLTEIVKDEAAWRRKHLMEMEVLAKSNPLLVPIDIGCGTGAFTLLAAKFLRKAIAIDPYLENLRVIQRALMVTQKASSVKQLLGIVSNTTTSTNKTKDSAPMAKLDDIAKVHILPNETVFVSVSLDGYELEALISGKQFFNTTRICFVLVNFSFQRTQETGSEIVKFMQGYGLRPYQDIPMKNSLKDVPATKFDSSVIFRGNSTDCLRKL